MVKPKKVKNTPAVKMVGLWMLVEDIERIKSATNSKDATVAIRRALGVTQPGDANWPQRES